MDDLDPPPEEIEAILWAAYGLPDHFNKRDPLSELVFVLLSTQTREPEYRRTFSALWTHYRSWERVRRASAARLERLIRPGGFAKRKVALLKALLDRIHDTRGATSLRSLRAEADDDALAYLMSLPGVGLKTAKCVLMYSLEREALPVDTHVWRVARRLGWIDGGGKHPDDRRSLELEKRIPPRLRASLHVTMIAHGRAVCRAQPRCARCALADRCDQGQRASVDAT